MVKPNSSSASKTHPSSPASPREGAGLKADVLEPTADELERLRDILFGSQSRTLEKRLIGLETDLKSLRQEFSESTGVQFEETRREFNKKLDKQGTDQSAQLRAAQKDLTERQDRQYVEQSSQLRAAQKDLAERLDRQYVEQSSQLQAVQKQLTDNLENRAADLLRQLRETHKELSDRLDKQGVEQSEARQRDDSLRQELLSMAAALDNKKVSRQDLSQMLMELGLRLQQESENS